MPWLDSLFANLYVRGAVSGVGVVTLAAGLAELAAAFGQRRETAAGQPGRTLPFDR